MEDSLSDIIASPATASLNAPIAIIRVSGCNCKTILHKLTQQNKINVNTINYKKIKIDEKFSDEIQFVFYKAPKSYTGEDSFEIFSHGNLIIVDKLLKFLINNGARIARPGEFTKRAYLNNKIDIVQAEAIHDIIFAQNEKSLLIAQKNKEGALSRQVNQIKTRIIKILEKAEMEIDFNDQEIEIYNENLILNEMEEIIRSLDVLCSHYDIAKRINQGAKVCIAGPINAGKSTIFNKLIGEDVAIVSNVPGTTRDVNRERLTLCGAAITLFDTAGIREASRKIEGEGISRAKYQINESDLVLYTVDSTSSKTWNLHESIEGFPYNRAILVFNKIDKRNPKGKIEEDQRFIKTIYISAKNNNLNDLKDELKKFFIVDRNFESIVSVNERQNFELIKARKDIINAKKVVMKPDLLSYEIKNAVEHIENIIGRINSEQILESIFKNFCIGK